MLNTVNNVQENEDIEADSSSSQKLSKKNRDTFWPLPLFILVPLQFLIIFSILYGAYILSSHMIDNKPRTQERPVFNPVYTVETYQAQKADNQPIIVTYGQTIAARNVDLRALVSGEIVSVNPRLKEGAKIAKGESLVKIDRFDYEVALVEAQSNLKETKARMTESQAHISLEYSKLNSAREQLAFAELDIERAKQLYQSGTMTQQQLENRKLILSQRQQAFDLSKNMIKVQEARVKQLNASLFRLKWRIKQAKKKLRSTTLIAPFTGIVKSSTAGIGRMIMANDVVVSLYESNTLEVKFTLTDEQYGRIQSSKTGLIGRAITITWILGEQRYRWPAKIERLSAEVSSTNGGIEVFARISTQNNTITLRPNTFVKIEMPDLLFKDTYRIPDSALYESNAIYCVVDGKLKKQIVNILAFDGESIILSSGLENGDQVLTTRMTGVHEGLSVRTEPAMNNWVPSNTN
ncbi:efflux RND transporter periplasmic adaptor subunit [Candidatus Endowatersipora endosymbiont of Watersipora subatra]|uniref:efflux RND transporter periplasmic adaptor subunit n=1 Tax=Candidatus Endowatersipora endosymbiont of Watersipora subatra TaxID=3077946 RepID=UPI00312CA5C0